MPNFETLLEALKLLKLNEAKQDQINFENKFGKALTDLFIQFKSRLKSPENDFYYWIKNKTVEELSDFLTELQNTKSKTQIKKEDKSGAELIYNKDGWKVYKILTYEASKYYGKGTKWCISGNFPGRERQGLNYFNDYKKRGVKDYYFIINDKDEKWCYLDITTEVDFKRFWNAADKGISLNSLDFPKEIPVDILDILPNFKDAFIDYSNIDVNNYIYYQDTTIPSAIRNKIINISINDNVHTIKTHAFQSLDKITSIKIPDNVKIIDNSAFSCCSNLTSIEIPDSVTSIGSYAFDGCSSLESVVIGDSVTSIRDFAFQNCGSLESIIIPNSVTSIGCGAFYDCTSLESIIIPNSVTSIGEQAFYGCSSLTSITISNSVTSIGDDTFMDCSNLTSIEIPDSVISIGCGAFFDCTSLTSITIPNSVTSIGEDAFFDCSKLTEITFGNICYEDFKFGEINTNNSEIVINYLKDSDVWNATNFDIEQLKKDFNSLFHIDKFDIIDKYGDVLLINS